MKNREEVRNILNTLFMLLALFGVVLYFAMPHNHIVGISVVGVGMVLKIAEFFIRFMF